MIHRLLCAMALACAPVAVQAQSIDFDSPGDTAAFGVDRYPPAVFQSGTVGGGRTGVLTIGTSAADGADNRPGAYSAAFYNTQGMQTSLDPGVTHLGVDLYIPGADWTASSNDRLAGLWGRTDVDAYPVFELARVSDVDLFRMWDSAGFWVNLGLPTGFSYNSWQTLNIVLDTTLDQIQYSVGDLSGWVSAYGSTNIETAFLQVYNTQEGVTRNQYMDNFVADAAVPEPATWLFLLLGFGFIGLIMRRPAQDNRLRLSHS